MSEGISYREILDDREAHHGFGRKHKPKKSHKGKALEKAKVMLTGKSQKDQMSKTQENVNYQRKIGRAWND